MRRKATALFGPLCLVTLAACGSDYAATAEVTEETTAPAEETTTEAVSLAGICPDTITFQTDWNPESEHGFLYNLVGEGYEVDAAGVRVTGPLVSKGADTGVKIQVRSGGPAVGFSPPTSLIYQTPEIFLAFGSHNGAGQDSGQFTNSKCLGPFP